MAKAILITGASSGLGKALAEKYAKLGWQVFACGRNQSALQQLQQQFGNISPVCFDVTNNEQLSQACEPLPPLDVVVLNAGTCLYINKVMQFDAQAFEQVINTNLVSIGYLLQALLPKLSAGARLALVGSSVSYLPFARAEAYGASKAGIRYLANSLRIDLASHSIAVSLIEPGFVYTPLTQKNNFRMPCIITSSQAADYIERGLAKKRDYIAFPNRFIWLLKLFTWLPKKWWQQWQIKDAL